MSDEGRIRDSKLTDRLDWNSRDGVTYSADDWQVVEAGIRIHPDEPTDVMVMLEQNALVALARLREREAQLEEALRPYIEKAASHEQLFSGEDLRNYQRAVAALAHSEGEA